MAERNLIIGGFTNYNINQLKPWVLSALGVVDADTDIVLMCGNASKETVTWLTKLGVLVYPMLPVQGVPIHVLRFLSIYDYLKKHGEQYEYVVTTDVKDVYFQKNPFTSMRKIMSSDNAIKLIAASEGLKYKDESWGDENLKQAYGQYVYDHFKNNEICNVGTFGGKSEYVRDMVFNIFTNAINRPIPVCDQAVFNVLINTKPISDSVIVTNEWAAELGTIMDPSKIDGFRPNLIFGEPTFENGVLRSHYGEIFPIVHQYDRVPMLKKFVQEKFEQDDESQLFVYKTT